MTAAAKGFSGRMISASAKRKLAALAVTAKQKIKVESKNFFIFPVLSSELENGA